MRLATLTLRALATESHHRPASHRARRPRRRRRPRASGFIHRAGHRHRGRRLTRRAHRHHPSRRRYVRVAFVASRCNVSRASTNHARARRVPIHPPRVPPESSNRSIYPSIHPSTRGLESNRIESNRSNRSMIHDTTDRIDRFDRSIDRPTRHRPTISSRAVDVHRPVVTGRSWTHSTSPRANQKSRDCTRDLSLGGAHTVES